MPNCGTISFPAARPQEQFVLLNVTCFRPQITLGSDSSAADTPYGGDTLATGKGTLFMDDDNGRAEPWVGPHNLDAHNAKVGDGRRNFHAREGGHGSDDSSALSRGTAVTRETVDECDILAGTCIGAHRTVRAAAARTWLPATTLWSRPSVQRTALAVEALLSRVMEPVDAAWALKISELTRRTAKSRGLTQFSALHSCVAKSQGLAILGSLFLCSKTGPHGGPHSVKISGQGPQKLTLAHASTRRVGTRDDLRAGEPNGFGPGGSGSGSDAPIGFGDGRRARVEVRYDNGLDTDNHPLFIPVVASLRNGHDNVGWLRVCLRWTASPPSSCEISAHCQLCDGHGDIERPRPHLRQAASPPSCCEISAQLLRNNVSRAHVARATASMNMPSAVI
jgi:hypothetical protein